MQQWKNAPLRSRNTSPSGVVFVVQKRNSRARLSQKTEARFRFEIALLSENTVIYWSSSGFDEIS